MYPWKQLARMSEEELKAIDVAKRNLACVADLPGAENARIADCLRWLDQTAKKIKRQTDKEWPRFERDPAISNHSPGYFRMMVMVTLLWKQYGVRYNPAKIPKHVPLDTADTFIHGVIHGDGGTCVSLPVVYIAIGRRLGYPLKLVKTLTPDSAHYFARWDGQGECFNVEANFTGVGSHSDEFYRTGDYHVPPDFEKELHLLRSMTAKEEQASFLFERAHRWLDLGESRRAVEAFAWATVLDPACRHKLKAALKDWQDKLDARKPKGFPPVMFNANHRFPKGFPEDLEQAILGMEATENILNNPQMNSAYWEPMRRGEFIFKVPTKADVFFNENDYCMIELTCSLVSQFQVTYAQVKGGCHVRPEFRPVAATRPDRLRRGDV